MAATGCGVAVLLWSGAMRLNRFGTGTALAVIMLHPVMTVVGQYEEDLEDWVGPAGEYIESMQFYETDTSRGFVRIMPPIWSITKTLNRRRNR